ncbi:YbjP/YqhG family protein [Escherichia albertii]|uniref:YbjP/YqhG family protein n=1 Tax=Escherichia albertii TaxID=208962 RepID=UPI000743D16F|nr:YbjP/YqhG family protein [Escherichia albertii]HAX3257015.1 YbjP/YqhG family protein [Escherichia albertii]
MKMFLLIINILLIFPALAQSPSLTAEQTVRRIYQDYTGGTNVPYFGDGGEKAITSVRMQKALTLNDNLTLPGNIGWLDYDPVYDCQDYGDLVLENVAITQTDADHAAAIVRFRLYKEDKEKITQTLKMVAENGRWVIDDVVSSHGSVWQAVNGENEKILTVLASLQKEQPEAFVDELFEHIADYSWPWTWVVSDTYRQAVNAFYKTTFRNGSNSDEDMQTERQFIYDNPICFGEETLFSHIDEIRTLEKNADAARIHVRFSLTNGNSEEQDLVLQKHEGKWEIMDFIRPGSGSLLKQIEAKTTDRLKQGTE